MEMNLADLICLTGAGQLCVLVASAMVPFRLGWKNELACLSRLHRQMYWTYAGYVVLGIIALGFTCVFCADELAAGTRLARAFCAYGAIFWGGRLALQAFFDAKAHLTEWWLTAGYHLLTLLFLWFTAVLGYAAFH